MTAKNGAISIWLLVVFIMTFSLGLRATHRWGCWIQPTNAPNFYNGANGEYTAIFDEVVSQNFDSWDNSTIMDLPRVGGPGFNTISGYNGFYGGTGWLGLATILQSSGCTINEGRSDLNQSYLDNGSYSRTNKLHVACQEVGHLFGLDHNEGANDTCMNDLILTAPHPNDHDRIMLNSMYSLPLCGTCPNVALLANGGQWVTAEDGGGWVVNANRASVGAWETFRLQDLGGGSVALQASNGQHFVAESGGGREVMANRTGVGPWETFRMIDLGGGFIALQASNGLYMQAAGGGGTSVNATGAAIGPWETFTLSYR